MKSEAELEELMLSAGGTYATMEWRAALNAADATHPQLWTAAADLLDNPPEACGPERDVRVDRVEDPVDAVPPRGGHDRLALRLVWRVQRQREAHARLVLAQLPDALDDAHRRHRDAARAQREEHVAKKSQIAKNRENISRSMQ